MNDQQTQPLPAPVAAADSCGPDLFETGDLDFMNFMAYAEGLLPASFFSSDDGKPFDRSTVDFKAATVAAAPFLSQTKDVRLLALLAKFCVLNRDLDGFARFADEIAKLIETEWEGVHPRGENGDFSMRLAAIQSLDDSATVALPLQHMPLAKPARGAPVSIRAQLIAIGDIAARPEEEQPNSAAIERALKECEISQLVEARDSALLVQSAFEAMRNTTVARTKHSVAAKFERVSPLTVKIIDFLNEAIERRDPSLASATGSTGSESADGAAGESRPGTAMGVISGTRSVAAALAAVENYFCRCEPSNPGLLLVRQAIQLIGKSFMEAVSILAPAFVDVASVTIGRSDMFQLPLQRLAEFSSLEGQADGGEEDPPVMEARSRAEAVTLMTQVVAFYARSEPSSPVPFLIERARALAGRDFLSILKDILPENTLRNLHSGNPN